LQLQSIAEGLKDIHEQGLVHRDFHLGNILSGKYENTIRCWITDLGLCQPVSESGNNEKIYGVLPYVAPEVLQSNPYTQAADIYSFGIVAYELFSGLPSYVVYDEKESSYKEIPHDLHLALKICQGLRPNLNAIQAPQLLKNLIKKC